MDLITARPSSLLIIQMISLQAASQTNIVDVLYVENYIQSQLWQEYVICGTKLLINDFKIINNMITEDYVSFETAKLLKEKGFDEDTNCYYIEGSVDKNLCYSPIRQNYNKRITNNEFDIDINISSGKTSAPTLQMAMKWLREVHKIFIKIKEYFDIKQYQSFVSKCGKTTYCEPDWFHPICNSYEEACEAAIKYCLESLI